MEREAEEERANKKTLPHLTIDIPVETPAASDASFSDFLNQTLREENTHRQNVVRNISTLKLAIAKAFVAVVILCITSLVVTIVKPTKE